MIPESEVMRAPADGEAEGLVALLGIDEELDYSAQVDRIKQMARSVLADYGLAGESLVLLMHTLNSTFRVDARSQGAAERYVLRVYRPDLYSEAKVRSEVEWLLALRRDEKLAVPEPVPNRAGDFVALAPAVDGLPGRCCVLFRWVEGQFLDAELDAEAVGLVGEFAARLHHFGETYPRRDALTRPCYDLDGLLGQDDVLPGPAPDFISKPDRETLREAVRVIREEAARLGRGPDVFGLIHGDLTQKNYLFNEGEVRAIDFADFGRGYYLYDIATVLLRLSDRPDFPALERAFLAGYRLRRPLPPEHEAHLEAFKAARVIYLLRFLLKHLDVPRVWDQARDGFPYMVGQVRGFLGRRLQTAGAPDAGIGATGVGAMTTVQFLAHLHRLDIELWMEGDRLRFSAPPGALTLELRQELAERKPDILQFLRQATGAGSGAPPIQPRPRTGDLPLSFAQERLWFFDQYEPLSPVYNISQAVHLRGRLHTGVLERCLGEILRRHEVLRTSFAAVDGRPIQVIASSLRLAIPIVDLLEAPDREERARRLVTRSARQPFDLGQAPLLRTLLLRLDEDEHIFLVTIHHIVSDGWSSGIFIRELLLLYDAFLNGRPAALAELPIQYADFALWQREWLTGGNLEQQLAYWKRQLEGAPQILELPTDWPRPPHQVYEGGKETQYLPRSLSDRLGTLCQQEAATLYMGLLAAFSALLHRYTGQEDILVGSPIAGRNRAEIEGLIGFFVNTLVLRTHPSGDLTFRELLEETRQATVAAYAHQDLPFEKLVEELQPERATSHTPLFQVMFALQNAPLPSLEREDLTVRAVPTESGRVGFDLLVTLRQQDDGLFLSLRYKKDLFSATTISRLAAHYGNLLRAVAADPVERLSDLPLLSDAELHQLRVEWNDTRRPSPRLAVHRLYEERADAAPDAPALIAGDRVWTYGEVDAEANRLAGHLLSLGICSGEGVALCLERSPELIVALLAILKAGGAYVPLDPLYPDERLSFLLEDVGASVVLVEESTRDRIGRLATGPLHRLRLVCVDGDRDAITMLPARRPLIPVEPASPAYVMYTSGSTGRPKGVTVPHAAVVRLVRETSYVDFSSDQVFLLLAPISFDASTFEIWGSLLNGARLAIQPPGKLGLEELGASLRRHGVTTLWLTAGLFHLMVDERLDDLDGVRQLLAGGDALSVPHVRRLLERRAVPLLVNGYGPTENTTFTACNPIRSAEQVGASVSIGRPIANTWVHVLDRSLRPVPIGVFGELCTGGDGLALGYLNRSGLTAERFIPDPFATEPGGRLYRTGDLVRYLMDGTLEFAGRFDQQVKIRGFRIELGEIEEALRSLPGVRDGVMAVREDVPGDKRIVAYVAMEEGSIADPRALRGLLHDTLPDFLVPSALVTLASLPLTPNGKVDRRALPAPGGSAAEEDEQKVAPLGTTEELIAGIWTEVLGRERIGRHDDFFELGGHSLLGTQVVSRVRAAFAVELPLQKLFEAPTVAGLARTVRSACERERGTEAPPILRVPREGGLPLSFAQQRLWFLDQLEPGSAAYNVPGAVRLKGDLRPGALEAAFAEVVHRHEALRTTFRESDGRPVQVTADGPSWALPVIDLLDLPPALREAEARRLVTAEAARPFDLKSGPLARFLLVRLAPREHAALVTMHHIVSDGWSVGVFLRELGALYRAFAQGECSPLPDLPVQYADFAAWQRSWLQGDVLDRLLTFWRRQLAGAPAVLALPTDRPRPPVQTFRGAVCPLSLPSDLSTALARLCRRQGATPFMALLGVFQALLGRLAGQSDVVVGSPIAGRNRREIEGLIGFFVNTLVLRADLAGDPTFAELLAQVRGAALDAYAHQDVPFERLVEEIAPERSLSHSPVFQVAFALQNAPRAELRATGLTFAPFAGERRTAKFDLTLSLQEGDDGIGGSLEYNTDLFDTATMLRLASLFERLLAQAAASPQRRLSELQWSSPTERHQLVMEWNDTGAAVPGLCAHRLFEVRAAAAPEAPAVAIAGEAWTYGELGEKASRLARLLRSLGVGPGSRAGVLLERSRTEVMALLAVLQAGGAYVPLDPSHPVERLLFTLEDARAEILLTDSTLAARLPEQLRLRTILLDQDLERIEAFPAGPLPDGAVLDDTAYVIYTSGSTGRPKGVEVTHRGLSNLIAWHVAAFGVSPEDRASHLSGLAFDASVWEIWPYLAIGASLWLPEDDAVRSSPAALRDWLAARAVTVAFAPTPVAEGLAQLDWPPETSLRLLLTGGDKLRRLPAFSLPCALINAYGPTESSVVATSGPAVAGADEDRSPSIGRPIANLEVYLVDADGLAVPLGGRGELCIGGEGLARGYLGKADLTAERFVPSPFGGRAGGRLYRTGDLARHLPDGRIEFLGRLDDQVKIRGFRIELGEVEETLRAAPGVADCIVLAREEAPGVPRLVAYVVSGGEAPPASGLRDALRRFLPEYMVPAAYVFLDALPLTPNGKVDRHALPAPALVPGEGPVAPRDLDEELIAGIWMEVLGGERVGVHDDFFELGGHSLLATQAVSRMRDAFGIELPLQTLFEAPTVARLAEQVAAIRRRERGIETPPIVPVPRGAGLPLSFAQQRLWFLDQLDPGGSVYNVPGAVRLNGLLSPRALAGAFGELVRRHEALRTTFALEGGLPVQRISAPVDMPLPCVDLTALPGALRDEEVHRLSAAEAERPFDLMGGPLVRCTLLRLGSEEHAVLVNMHHIVSDGWSTGIFLRELAALYEALSGGKAPSLPPLPVQYADFAVWQRRWLEGQVLEEEMEHWRRQLSGMSGVLELPTDRPRPPVQTFRGSSLPVALSRELSEALAALSRREGATLYMTLLAAFQVLLGRLSGQEDVAVGSPIAGRSRREIEGLIGFFVNTLVLRADLSGDPSCGALLAQVRGTALAAFAHQDVPFERLVEDLAPIRDLSRSPLFQVLFALQNAPGGELKATGLTFATLSGERRTAKFDLTLSLQETGAGVLGSLEYNTDLFDRSTALRIRGQLERILADIAADPGLRLSELGILRRAERHQIFVEWNDTAAAAPGGERCLHELFEAQAARTPEAIALVHGEVEWTYRDLDRRANQLVRHLRAMGVEPERAVGVCARRTPDLVASLLAVLKAGGAYVPLDPNYPPDRLALMLEDSRATVLMTQRDLVDMLPPHQAELLLLEDLAAGEAGDAHPVPSGAGPENLAYFIYTSGSTGRPKGVAIEHLSACVMVRWAHRVFTEAECAGVLASTSVCFDLSIFEIFVPLTRGGCVILVENALALPGLATAERVTLINTVPSAMTELVRLGAVPPSVRTVNLAGEPLPARLVQDLHGLGTVESVWNLYGPSEDTTYSTYVRMEKDDSRPPTIGTPLDRTQAYLLDAAQLPVPLGVHGEIHLGGLGLARGYFGRPELTAEKFVPNPFATRPGERLYRTGDLARHLPDGRIDYLGRTDHQIKIRGFRVELGEIETAVRRHPGVRETAVVVDKRGGGRLVAFFVAKEDHEVRDAMLHQFLGESLPAYMVPAVCVRLASLPLTPNGKVDRKDLTARSADEVGHERHFMAPRDSIELELKQIWEEVLDRRPIGVTESFFQLGGHSLKAAQLMARVRERFGCDLPIMAVFQAPTIESLAGVLRNAEVGRPQNFYIFPLQPKGDRPPFFCIPGAVGSVFHLMDLARETGGPEEDRPFYGVQAKGLADDGKPLSTVEELAEHYLVAIRGVRPSGPYHLGGFSMGGVVAYEIARRLLDAGEEVRALVMLDAFSDLGARMGELNRTKALFELAAGFGIEAGLEELGAQSDEEQIPFILEKGRVTRAVPLNMTAAELEQHFRVLQTSVEAGRRYRATHYPGKVTVIRAERRPRRESPNEDLTLGWEAVAAGGVEVMTTPGGHGTMLHSPCVEVLGRLLRDCLDRAETD